MHTAIMNMVDAKSMKFISGLFDADLKPKTGWHV